MDSAGDIYFTVVQMVFVDEVYTGEEKIILFKYNADTGSLDEVSELYTRTGGSHDLRPTHLFIDNQEIHLFWNDWLDEGAYYLKADLSGEIITEPTFILDDYY